jgi:ribonuclease J
VTSPLRILPLGGLGEIGKNMMVLEHEGRLVVIDAGLMFPTSEMLGIDLVLPDFSSLRERAGDIEAIVLTHGHEDHVGALPYVLREIGMPGAIYGGALTVGLVRSKLEEHKLRDAPLEVLDSGARVDAGPFGIELVHMSHSIPDSCAVAPSESSVGPALLEVFGRCPGRIVVTCFASNVHRVQQVIDAAAALDRKVALVGRSMRKNFNIASNLGIATAPEGLLIPPKEIQDFPDERVVALSTGSQGEPLSALRRMAHGDHPDIELHSGDAVIFSATPIPGNERSVSETIDRIFQIGASVITTTDAPIHASGHAWQEELKLMLNLTRARFVLPAHGDHRRLHLHAELAESVGTDPDRIFKGRNGLALEIRDNGEARFGDDAHAGLIFVDGVDIGDPDDVALRDRRMLSADGVFIVVATISSDDGSSVAAPEIIFRGVPFVEEADGLVEELRGVVERSLADAAADEVREVVLLQEDLHDDIAEFVYERMRRRPMVLPVVVEV